MFAKILLFCVCSTAVSASAYQAGEVNGDIKSKEYSTVTMQAVNCEETYSIVIISPVYVKSVLEYAAEYKEYGYAEFIDPAKKESTNAEPLCRYSCRLINEAQLETNQTLKNIKVVNIVDNYLDITRWPKNSNLCVGYVYGQYDWQDPTTKSVSINTETVCIPLNYKAYMDVYYNYWMMKKGQEKSSYWNTQSNFNERHSGTKYGVGTTVCQLNGRYDGKNQYVYYNEDEIMKLVNTANVTVATVI